MCKKSPQFDLNQRPLFSLFPAPKLFNLYANSSVLQARIRKNSVKAGKLGEGCMPPVNLFFVNQNCLVTFAEESRTTFVIHELYRVISPKRPFANPYFTLVQLEVASPKQSEVVFVTITCK